MTSTRRHHDQGLTSLETAVLTPVLLALLMLVVQFGLTAHAQSVAEAAAQQAVDAGRPADATDADARARADDALRSLGPTMLSGRDVEVTRTPETVTVTISGESISLIPFLRPRVEETATGPVERYAPPVEP